ncbi:molybdopterin-dependent oxidoreductase-like protein [Mucilaginibacter yixingensis]|uniref:Molybdopterin-dependent oxidoreductase-like protein n=1 Tax=Mucilaginibacter yixingensis TaxID=1295612 RepID=A0A2T5JA34_9SPHI|nr:molybdopterin-dependent oxidoreductase [Mucilaginibacter yixingensis]PTQ96907.1 molybdopterin-dependent oxidoreductase-like protein [Mucilaginibacter yixingensis]
MKKYAIVLLLLAAPFLVNAQAEKQASVKITGEVTTPLTITPDNIKTYEQTKVTRKDRDGKDHTYTGVLLSTLLQKAGVTMGKDLKGENLVKYVLASASDGYQVTFALAELDKEFTDRAIILATQIDGQPLAAADGPFRIIVQDEKKPARCMKQVTELHIAFAK